MLWTHTFIESIFETEKKTKKNIIEIMHQVTEGQNVIPNIHNAGTILEWHVSQC